jgi:hypothetical protein
LSFGGRGAPGRKEGDTITAGSAEETETAGITGVAAKPKALQAFVSNGDQNLAVK